MQQSGDWTARHSDQPLAGVSRLLKAPCNHTARLVAEEPVAEEEERDLALVKQ
jgi:hypothetical protein